MFDVEFLKGKICSSENLVIGIWNELLPHLPQACNCIPEII
jgi:6-pyruvoyltetrahydropterin/6-carboxytetrahydropterin synthase